MKKFNRFLALALCGASLMSLSACFGGGGGGGFDMDETDADVTKITILASDWNEYNSAVKANTPVYQALKAAVGCDIEAESVAASQLDLTIDLRRENEELPEIIRIFGPYKSEQYESLIREGDLVAISDYVNESTKSEYPYLYEHMKQFDYMKSNVSYANGKVYFVPTYWGNEKSLWVRTDWIQNLNNKLPWILVQEGVIESESQATRALLEKHQFVIPTTLTEFYRLARAFTMYDPDNDRDFQNTKGYVTENNRDFDSWMYVACDTGWKQWMQDKDPYTGAAVNSGTYVYSSTTEGSKVATSIFNKMYAEKYISVDSSSNGTGDKHSSFYKGTAGMMYAHNWYNYHVREMTTVYKDSLAGSTEAEKFQSCMDKVAAVAPPAGVNGTYGGHTPYSSCYLPGPAINARMSEARIKKCLKLIEFFYSPEGQHLFTYGVEGVDYEMEGDTIKTLHKPDKYGVTYRLTEYDYASRLTYVMELPIETEIITTNGEMIVGLAKQSMASQCYSDYLDIVTATAKKFLPGANSFFDEECWRMMLEKDYAANWKYDEKTWATDGWTKLYTVSPKFQTQWSTFAYKYNGDGFKGSLMQEEYNDFIASGKAQKRPGL